MTAIPKELQAMPFGDMIGGPLSACIEAQEKAAMTTVNFIHNVGFEKHKDAKTGQETISDNVINVIFRYKREGEEVELSVPLLTIVPIPYIAIDTVTIDFKAQLKSVTKTTYEYTSGQNSGWNYANKQKVEMTSSVSTKKDSKSTRDSQYSVEATIDVNVLARQDSMPAGLAKVLEMLNQAISATPVASNVTAK